MPVLPWREQILHACLFAWFPETYENSQQFLSDGQFCSGPGRASAHTSEGRMIVLPSIIRWKKRGQTFKNPEPAMRRPFFPRCLMNHCSCDSSMTAPSRSWKTSAWRKTKQGSDLITRALLKCSAKNRRKSYCRTWSTFATGNGLTWIFLRSNYSSSSTFTGFVLPLITW